MHLCTYAYTYERKREREEERRGMIRREREKRKNKGKQIREVGWFEIRKIEQTWPTTNCCRAK